MIPRVLFQVLAFLPKELNPANLSENQHDDFIKGWNCWPASPKAKSNKNVLLGFRARERADKKIETKDI